MTNDDNVIKFPEGLPEPSAEELSALNSTTLESLGFAFGMREFWPKDVPFTPPSEEELRLATFVASYADSLEATGKTPPPAEWKASSEERLRQLRVERAKACGYTGFLGFFE